MGKPARIMEERRQEMLADDVIYQVVPMVITLFVLLVAFRPRPGASAAGALVEKAFMALYETSSWLILGFLIEELDAGDD
jgi:hypothetical protein